MYLLMKNIVEHIKYGVTYGILSRPAYSPMVSPLYHRLYQVQNRNVFSKCPSSASLFSLVVLQDIKNSHMCSSIIQSNKSFTPTACNIIVTSLI